MKRIPEWCHWLRPCIPEITLEKLPKFRWEKRSPNKTINTLAQHLKFYFYSFYSKVQRFEYCVFTVSIFNFNPFLSSIAFYIKTSQFIFAANQMTGFYTECNTSLKWVILNVHKIHNINSAEAYLKPDGTSAMKLFCQNSQRLKAVNYFCKKKCYYAPELTLTLSCISK